MMKDGDPFAYPPRGLTREEAARYVGIGVTKFDELVAERRMPRPKRVGGRVVWDRYQIDAYFTDLPDQKSGLEGQLEASGKRRN
ncbi:MULTISPECIES: helix-turn-helix transcriptional regulator [Sinorhizobium]|uniref:Helix-turn-helix domain-containing protein n=1 Tax=Sinorhizobium medicae TaxID=110321 RepID=A0ABX4TNW7_9HYPH|nr:MULTISPECIES: hypothetical protein [Sinorhizobium]MDX0213834.1 hypothetical protein [Sinorhizobium meliloti]MDX0517708.1 hypothetical protein [Sinorhizobium medicae]MDX0566658.1 hypothetical protein [Sinorhizobium medicae]MDX0579283.1 hypothetical protein [Sinorhizobium medicae]MDX0604548.1 hypothetical protein [Sinorhizobium medicae]